MTRSQRPVWLGEDRRGWDHARLHRQLAEDPRLKVYEIGVYYGLAIHAETMTGAARPARSTLAAYLGVSVRSVQRALDRLTAAGYIEIDSVAGKASIYRLLPPPNLSATQDSQAQVAAATQDSQSHHPGLTDPGTQDSQSHEQEPVNENHERAGANAPAALTLAETFDLFWQRYPPRTGIRRQQAKALAVWQRMSLDDRRAAYRAAGHFAERCAAELDTAPDAFRWLREKRWVEHQEHVPLPPTPPRNGSRSSYLDRPGKAPLAERVARALAGDQPALPIGDADASSNP